MATRAARSRCSRRPRSTSARAAAITTEVAREAMQQRFARYDKAGEEHFNLLSALPQVAPRQRSAGRALLDGAHDRRRRGSDDALPPRDRDGGGGHRPRRPERAAARGGGARRLSHARPARGIPAAGGDDDLPRDGAQVEQHEGRARRRAGSGPEHAGRAGADAHPERADRPHEGAGIRHGAISTPTIRPTHTSRRSICPTSSGAPSSIEPGPFGYERRIAERLAWWERRKQRAARAARTGEGRVRARPGDPDSYIASRDR